MLGAMPYTIIYLAETSTRSAHTCIIYVFLITLIKLGLGVDQLPGMFVLNLSEQVTKVV